MYCPSFPEAPTMQILIVCVPERPGHSVSSDSPLDAAIDEGLRGLGAGSDSMRTTRDQGHSENTRPCDCQPLLCSLRVSRGAGQVRFLAGLVHEGMVQPLATW